MCPSVAARIGFVKKASIGMSTKYHVASPIDNAVILIGSNVVEK
jgi:hypothetical protein